MKPLTRKEAVKEIDACGEQLADWAVDLENTIDDRMDKLQKIMMRMDKFQKHLEKGKDAGQ
ncbi:MAG: hypothetical protein AAGH72_09375 [Verrucomicrobiota bacterium]